MVDIFGCVFCGGDLFMIKINLLLDRNAEDIINKLKEYYKVDSNLEIIRRGVALLKAASELESKSTELFRK